MLKHKHRCRKANSKVQGRIELKVAVVLGDVPRPSCAVTWTAIRYRALEPRARLYRGRSVDAAPLVEDESLDMAFIVRAGDSRERKLQRLLQEERDSSASDAPSAASGWRATRGTRAQVLEPRRLGVAKGPYSGRSCSSVLSHPLPQYPKSAIGK